MTVKDLIETLNKLPPQVHHQDVMLKTASYTSQPLYTVRWEGTYVRLEAKS